MIFLPFTYWKMGKINKIQTYTSSPVSWATQKGDILGFFFCVCVQKVAQLGGGDKNQFSVCVWPTFLWPSEKKRVGDTFILL